MNELIKSDYVFGMAHLTTKRTGLDVSIWSEHSGILRKFPPNGTPRVIIGFLGGIDVSVTIDPNPEIITTIKSMKESEMYAIKKGIQYVAKNFDVFLNHYMDTDGSFDDEDMTVELRRRGEYK